MCQWEKAGVIWLLREEDVGFVGNFLIDGAYRRQGYGVNVLRHIEELTAQSGMMRLGVFKNNGSGVNYMKNRATS